MSSSSGYIPPHMRRRGITENKKNSQIKSIMEGNGPMGTLMLVVLDTIIDILLDFAGYFSAIFQDGMDYMHEMTFGNYHGMFGNEQNPEKYGICFSWKMMRYLITVITPPVGVFMAKGLKGWFSVLLCMVLCYFHYAIGIVYAFVVANSSKYGDMYELYETNRISKIKEKVKKEGDETPNDLALYAGVALMITSFVVLILFIQFIMKRM